MRACGVTRTILLVFGTKDPGSNPGRPGVFETECPIEESMTGSNFGMLTFQLY